MGALTLELLHCPKQTLPGQNAHMILHRFPLWESEITTLIPVLNQYGGAVLYANAQVTSTWTYRALLNQSSSAWEWIFLQSALNIHAYRDENKHN